MKRLSLNQANQCENARKPRCRCRCGGSLHGSGRGPVTELPAEDPHFAQPPREERKREPQAAQLQLGL